MAISISCPCTCGELFQGSLDGQPCLVSCPISVYSTTTILQERVVEHLPDKARKALERLGIAALPPLLLRQQLPKGRGYGTSTADIGSVLFAVSQWAGQTLDGLEASRIAVSIEPTDSSLLPGLALFDHRKGGFYEELGQPPEITIITMDPGGAVDSEAFNKVDWSTELSTNASIHCQAFELLKEGIRKGNIAEIGEAATMSATSHQSILHSPWLEPALTLARQTGAAGVCRAHSGTVLGILFPTSGFESISIMPFIRKYLPRGIQLRQAALTSGGRIDRAVDTPLEVIAS